MDQNDQKTSVAVKDPPAPPVEKEAQKAKFKPPKKKRKWIKRLLILVVIAAVVVFFVMRTLSSAGKTISSAYYAPSPATIQDLTVTVSSTGTVEPIDSYKVTALVRGEILEAPFEEGQTVQKDVVLFRIDSSSVETSIDRAVLALEQAQLAYNDVVKSKNDSQKDLQIKSNATGVILKLYYKQGETVAAGTPFADVLDRENMTLTVPFHSVDAAGFYVGQPATVTVDGTTDTLVGVVDKLAVTEQVGLGGTLVRDVTIKVVNPGALDNTSTGTAAINGASCASGGTFEYGAQKTVTAKTSGELQGLKVQEGDWVSEDQVLGSIKSPDFDNQIENARLSVVSAELSLQSTRDQLDDYTITSPISGTVIEKNFKVGDNVDPSTSASAAGMTYMAVIYDMSTLTFDMKIDELDINKIKVGQTVSITADALEGKSFTGRVDKININGVTQSGVTSYPVTVVIDDPQELLPGMNVSAEIVVDEVKGVLCVPVNAVARGNTVTVALPGALDENGNVVDLTKLETRQVTLGRNDSKYIEITSGLEEGDTVVLKNEASDFYAMMMGG